MLPAETVGADVASVVGGDTPGALTTSGVRETEPAAGVGLDRPSRSPAIETDTATTNNRRTAASAANSTRRLDRVGARPRAAASAWRTSLSIACCAGGGGSGLRRSAPQARENLVPAKVAPHLVQNATVSSDWAALR